MSPTRNTLRFQQVIAAIQAHPDRWDQALFTSSGRDPLDGSLRWITDPSELGTEGLDIPGVGHVNVCGQTQCIGGWAVALEGEDLFTSCLMKGSWQEEAARILGITENEARWLFYDTIGLSQNTVIQILGAFARGDSFQKIKARFDG